MMAPKSNQEDVEKERLLSRRFAESSLPEIWSRYTGKRELSIGSNGTFLIDENKMQLGGYLSTISLRVYQIAELLQIKSVTLSDICGLRLLDITMFLALAQLTELAVTKCPDLLSVICTCPDYVLACKLVKLNFSRNALLTKLPLREIENMAKVTELDCRECPNLWSPPHEVADQGGTKTMDFLRVVARDGETNSAMTLFLLGDGEAGKTSVFVALRSRHNKADRIREDQRTVGIDTEEWMASPTMRFQVFDLAGQAVYEATHQFNLQQRALYLLVWRAFPITNQRHRVLLDRVQHWMDSMQMRVPGAHIMLVVTQIGRASCRERVCQYV